ncbi:MAG TPA: protein translocase subunit SecF [Candidatus Doudnabacteria bacterium]|nr:protein translocase subunit SecF [Candidatus Doudnabacteria bacterium]
MKFLNYYKYFFVLSGAFVVIGVLALAIFGLNLGIDFRGGTVVELSFNEPVTAQDVRGVLAEQGLENAQVQATDENGIIIRTAVTEKEENDRYFAALREQIGEYEERRYESIGPVVGEQLSRKALYQLILVSVGIILYIAYAFRKVTRPVSSWQFGVAAIAALLHDLIVVLGIFAVLGKVANIEVDSMFVTAMLTVLGFSVHDTIIVFDRIRENLRIYAGQSMEFVVNHSITQTIARSLNTSLTVLLVLLALLLFGGDTIRYFVLALFIGIIAGTYSSIFVASPILSIWQERRMRSR